MQTDLDLKYEDQTLAVYPANIAPHPWPFPYHMDREKGIEAYQAMITAEEYKQRLERGETEGLAHEYKIAGDAPVIRVEVNLAEKMTEHVTKYELKSLDGSPLPDWEAGAHLDVVVAPEFLRQFSLSGNPADKSKYQLAVLREDEGRGGSTLLHRIFAEGRKIFVSKPINHFPLIEEASKSFLMGGGIGITPMIAFAHRLNQLGKEFEFHYSCSKKKDAGFLDDLPQMPWADKIHYHFSDQGSRADLDEILSNYEDGWHVYTCGPERYMNGVMEAAEKQGFPDEARHLEFFSVPEQPDYENHDFTLRLKKSGKDLHIPADRKPTDILLEAGISVDVKCDDGICGVCKCSVLSGEVEHRDFVLSKAQREDSMILCQSRAAKKDAVIEIDL